MKINQDWNAVLDSMCFCKFGIAPQGPIDVADVAKYFNNVVGPDSEYKTSDLLLVGERIFTVHRLFGIREKGLTPEDDMVQPRFLEKNERYNSESK